ncbi:hypothetical protein [Nocardioides sp. GXQ0305]|uniref:hypothetical protein n=1 Tax=Nocardioides sp. GXQ0305 TaxID=3423912 RepID=UPI003D7C94E9
MKKHLLPLAVSAATVASALTLAPSPALAGDGDVEKARGCGGFRIELKVGPEDGGWEVESDVDDASAGSDWRIRIRHDGRTVFNRVRTAGPGGDVEVDLRRPDTRGADRFRFRAHPVGNPDRACALRITRR